MGRPLPPHQHGRLAAAQDGAGSADSGHARIPAVLVSMDRGWDAAEGGRGILADGGPHVRGGRLSRPDL